MAETSTEPVASHLQLAPDGSGKKVRNLAITVLSAGVEEIRYLQVVSIADLDGRPVRTADAWQDAMLEQAMKTNELLTALIGEIA